ncbi:MAG: hypothetical protein VW455_00910 [Nitrospinota bacterium]
MIFLDKFKKAVSPLYNNPFGDFLRAKFQIRPPRFVRPLSGAETISDLFVWRVDEIWETRYTLMNLPSYIFPDQAETDHATLITYNEDGNEIYRNNFELKPFECQKTDIRDLLQGKTGQGTFACFHSAGTLDKIQKAGCYLTDRQYVSYSWKGDNFCNFVHGNIYGLSKSPFQNKTRALVPWQGKMENYRPQLRFDDCDRFELVYSNPSEKPLKVEVRLFDSNWREKEIHEILIPIKGVKVLEFNNPSRELVFIENQSRIGLCRPVIFKHYESFFDVLHS